MRYLLVLGLSAVAQLSVPARADTQVGRWCSKPLPTLPIANSVITIREIDGTKATIHMSFGDGSELEYELYIIGDWYESVGNSDKYTILDSGDLGVYDDQGYIRTATKLGNTPRQGECLPG